jgi:hypothetical protein
MVQLIKYTVEIEIQDEIMSNLNTNPAGLNIDELVRLRIESALFPLCKGNILVYRSEEGKKLIDLFKICPVCGHPWAFHFEQTQNVTVRMSDGTAGVRGVLVDPVPIPCVMCEGESRCQEALKYGVK